MIRLYKNKDLEKLVAILRLNTPEYFAVSEEKDFIKYLEHHSQNYLVVEEVGIIIGSGGFNYLDDGKEVRISWDMFHPHFHGKGMGSKLTQYKIDEIKNNSEIEMVTVRTSQLAFKFYEKFGFELIKSVKDFWAKGFDLYQMELKIR